MNCLFIHHRKGVGNQKEKKEGGVETVECGCTHRSLLLFDSHIQFEDEADCPQ